MCKHNVHFPRRHNKKCLTSPMKSQGKALKSHLCSSWFKIQSAGIYFFMSNSFEYQYHDCLKHFLRDRTHRWLLYHFGPYPGNSHITYLTPYRLHTWIPLLLYFSSWFKIVWISALIIAYSNVCKSLLVTISFNSIKWILFKIFFPYLNTWLLTFST